MATTETMPAEVFPPGEFLQDELETRDWSQADLADILGKDTKTVSEIILGKRRITPEMARLLSQALETSPQVWLNLESQYQLYKSERSTPVADDVSRRARLYEKFPVRDMIKRGWIDQTDNVDVLEAQLKDFATPIPFAARRKDDQAKTSLQLAWLHRTYYLSRRLVVERFSDARLQKALDELKPLLHSAEDVRKVPEVLSKAGVRFLIVEALPGSKIDGACFWLDSRSPVVAISLRYDRIDHFWFTLLHELQHIRLGHGKSQPILDTDVIKNDSVSEDERKADEAAGSYMIPPAELEEFISRVKPLISTRHIRDFADRVGVHMGIVVGQLQHRNVIDWGRNRNSLVKVRSIITEAATYDGWDMVA